MSVTKSIRDVQRKYEAIPTLGAIFYNAVPAKVLRKSEAKIASEIVERIGSGTILDLGSGTGYLAIEIARKAPRLQVYGIDLSSQMIKISRHHARGLENARFELGNAASLRFADNSIDFIVSTGSLHHWKTPAKVFGECYRVLKVGGEAWVYDGCPDAFKGRADRTRREYGIWIYRILPKVAELHGFAKEEYESAIKDILEQTQFKDGYHMELKDVWMKITLKKQG